MIPPTSDPLNRMRELEILCRELAEALEEITSHPATGYPQQSASGSDHNYKIGITDGHRAAANIARAALERYNRMMR